MSDPFFRIIKGRNDLGLSVFKNGYCFLFVLGSDIYLVYKKSDITMAVVRNIVMTYYVSF
jgi:hypothetical protein